MVDSTAKAQTPIPHTPQPRRSYAVPDDILAPASPQSGQQLPAGGSRVRRRGRLLACEFQRLPARPMRVHEVADAASVSGLEREIAAAVASAPPDVVLQLRVPDALAGAKALRAASLRALGPPTVNVSVSVRLSGPSRRALLRADLLDA